MDPEEAAEFLFKKSPKADKLRRESKRIKREESRKEWWANKQKEKQHGRN